MTTLRWVLLLLVSHAGLATPVDFNVLYDTHIEERNALFNLPIKKRLERTPIWEKKAKRRRLKILETMNDLAGKSASELVYGAKLLQQGTSQDEKKGALLLMRSALNASSNNPEVKYAEIKYLVCEYEDRFLLAKEEPQIWGTQLERKRNHKLGYDFLVLKRYDPLVKGDERVHCGLPSLADMNARLERMSLTKDIKKQYQIWRQNSIFD